MFFETVQMEYGMFDSRSAADLNGASGCVSAFQKSVYFHLQNNSFKG
jgi:hypothetical protein